MRVEAVAFEHVDSRDLDIESELRRLGHALRRANHLPPLEVFRSKEGGVFCVHILPEPKVNGLEKLCSTAGGSIDDRVATCVIQAVKRLHDNGISVWPRSIEESVIVGEDGGIFLTGVGYSQITRESAFEPSKDLAQLITFLQEHASPFKTGFADATSIEILLSLFTTDETVPPDDAMLFDPDYIYLEYQSFWLHVRLHLGAEEWVRHSLSEQGEYFNAWKRRIGKQQAFKIKRCAYSFHEKAKSGQGISSIKHDASKASEELPDLTNKLTSLFFHVTEKMARQDRVPTQEPITSVAIEEPVRAKVEVSIDIQRLFDVIKQFKDGSKLDGNHLQFIQEFLRKSDSLTPGIRSWIWQIISQIRLGWSREVFYHAYEISNDVSKQNSSQFLYQIERDIPRCHSYRTTPALQDALKRLLWGWQWFDLAQFEREGIDFDSLKMGNDIETFSQYSGKMSPNVVFSADVPIIPVESTDLIGPDPPITPIKQVEDDFIEYGTETLSSRPFDRVLQEMQESSELYLSRVDATDSSEEDLTVDQSTTRTDVVDDSDNIRDGEHVKGTSHKPFIEPRGSKRSQNHLVEEEPSTKMKKDISQSHTNVVPRRSYWQGLDSIAMAMLLGCNLDEITSLQCLNLVTHNVLQNRIFVEGRSDLELMGRTLEALLNFMDPDLFKALQHASEGEPLRMIFIPWLLSCLCHSLPLTSLSNDPLLTAMDYIMADLVSVPALCAAILISAREKLVSVHSRDKLRFFMVSFPGMADAILPKALKLCLEWESISPFPTNNLFLISNVQNDDVLIHIPWDVFMNKSDSSLVVDLSNPFPETESSILKISLRPDLLMGLDLMGRDGDVIVQNLKQRRDGSRKSALVVFGGNTDDLANSLALELVRALKSRSIPRCCLLCAPNQQ